MNLCTPRESLHEVTVETIDSYLGRDRPVYLRMIFAGCEYAPPSYKGWQAAAELYPHISFLELDCLKGGSKSMELCSKYQAIAKGKADGVSSPSHVIFKPGEKEPVADSWLGVMSRGGDPEPFIEQITNTLKVGHVEYLKMLGPESTDEFIASKEYSVMILYNSACVEDTNFVGKWASGVSQDLAPVPFSTSDIAFGRLDCSKFPNECSRWSELTPCAVFHKKAGESLYGKVIKTCSDDLGSVVDSAKSDLADIAGAALPEASSVTPSPPIREDDTGYVVIRNEALEQRSVESVKALYRSYKSEFDGSSWSGEMTNLNECVIGESNIDDRKQATVNVNIMRALAGVDNVTLNDEQYLSGCQLTALVLHKVGYITHYPNVDRTDICINGEKAVVAEYAEKSNLAQNVESITKSISLFMEDLGEENAQAVGHRRWILNPNVKSIGFGYVPQRSYPSGVEGINHGRPSIAVMRIVTPGDEPYNKVNFVSWPSAGPFPAEHVPPVWHVSSRVFRDSSVSKSDIKVLVTRDDGKDIPVKTHFLNRQYMGTPDALLLHMDEHVKELCTPGRRIHVEIWVTNKKTKLEYWFTVFDLKSEVNLCLYDQNPGACDSYEPGYKFGSGSYDQISSVISSSQSERAVIFVGEELHDSLNFDGSVEYLLNGASISGTINVGVHARVEVSDPSKTSVIVNWDVSSNAAGQFVTGGKAKELSVKPAGIPSKWSKIYSRADVYKGQAVSPKFVGDEIQEYEDGYLFFGNYINGSVIGASLSYLKYILVLRTGDCADASDEIRLAYQIHDLKSEKLGQNLGKKKFVRWYICDDSGINIDKSIFPADRYQDYEIIAAKTQAGGKVTFAYDPSMEKTIRSVSFSDLKTDSVPLNNKFGITTTDNTWIVRHPGIRINYDNLDVQKFGPKISIPDLDERSSQTAVSTFKKELDYKSDSVTGSADSECGCWIEPSTGVCRCEFTPDSTQCMSQWKWYRFKTSGKHANVVSRLWTYDYRDGVRPHQFLPIEGTESTKIHLKAEGGLNRTSNPRGPYVLPYVDEDPAYDQPLVPLIIENYQDITLEVNGDMLSSITYKNVGKVTLDLGWKRSYGEILVNESGKWSSYLSSVHGMTIQSLKVTSDSNVQAEMADVTNLQTTSASCRLSGLTVTDSWDISDSIVTVSGANIKGTIKVARKNRFPHIIVEGDGSSFAPKKIEYDMGYDESKSRVLDIVSESTTLVSGISSSTCEAIKGRVSLVNAPHFSAVCASDGSLRISRTYDNGKNEDIGGGADPEPSPSPSQSPGENFETITGDRVWESEHHVPSNVRVEGHASLSLIDGRDFAISSVELGESARVTATNLLISNELKLSGSATLSAASGSKITIADGQTKLVLRVAADKAPLIDMGAIGEYKDIPASVLVDVNDAFYESKVLVRGRTLNCDDWLKVFYATGELGNSVQFRCAKGEEETKEPAALSDMLDEWAIIMEQKSQGSGSRLPPGAVAGIVIGAVALVGAVIGVSIYFARSRNEALRRRKTSQRLSSEIELQGQ